jgi:hypothetical protein
MIDARIPRRRKGRGLTSDAQHGLVDRCIGVLSRRREHRSDPDWKHAKWSWANGLTALRAVVAVTILGLSIHDRSRVLLVAGLVASWSGDMFDGHIARACGCETVLGAQIDGLADRLTAMLVVLASIRIADGSFLAVAAGSTVWLQFGVLDHALSAQFLYFGRWSPDEMHLDDEDAWRRNWAPIAKIVSNIPVGLLAFGGFLTWGAMICAAALLALRTSSSLRLLAGHAVHAPTLAVSSSRGGRPTARPRRHSNAAGASERGPVDVGARHRRDAA